VVGAPPVILSGKEWKGIVAIGAGVMAGDVIKKVDNKPVNDIEPFKEVIKPWTYPKKPCWIYCVRSD
jgi:C-terminal processing protease CtpA/Prc